MQTSAFQYVIAYPLFFTSGADVPCISLNPLRRKRDNGQTAVREWRSLSSSIANQTDAKKEPPISNFCHSQAAKRRTILGSERRKVNEMHADLTGMHPYNLVSDRERKHMNESDRQRIEDKQLRTWEDNHDAAVKRNEEIERQYEASERARDKECAESNRESSYMDQG